MSPKAQAPGGGTESARDGDDSYRDPPMTIWQHLAELRRRLIIALIAIAIGCIAAWELREWLLVQLVDPFATAWRVQNLPGEPTLHFASPAAAFIAYLKLAIVGGAAMASPVVFYQLWRFVAPGLYGREKRYVIPFVLSSSVLFVGGGYFGWRAAFPIAFRYLLSMSDAMGERGVVIAPTVMMGDYISFVSRLLVAFGLVFEIPLVVFFLSVAGVVNYLQLIRYGRWFVIVAFVLAAFITPPDIASQVLMAVPMVVLYGGSILLAYFFGKKPTEAQRRAYARRKKRRQRARARQQSSARSDADNTPD